MRTPEEIHILGSSPSPAPARPSDLGHVADLCELQWTEWGISHPGCTGAMRLEEMNHRHQHRPRTQ